MNKYNTVSVILGDEFDDNLRRKLFNALMTLDAASVDNRKISLAGSQYIESFEVFIEKHRIYIEFETYIGITIEGPEYLIKKITNIIST